MSFPHRRPFHTAQVDTRFSYCALCCLAIVGRMDAIDVAKATAYVASCRNFDGGFGCVPGAESHAGQGEV